jgi:metallo-beta-lactamase family protein
MAIQATKLYARHVELFDDEALAMQKSGELAEKLDTVKFCPSADDSRALNEVKGPCLIMAGAGMCTGGRILHHFRHNLSRYDTTVLFVGYQGHGSLGRMIVDGKKAVTIFGEKISVRASVHTSAVSAAMRAKRTCCDGSIPLPRRPRVYSCENGRPGDCVATGPSRPVAVGKKWINIRS